ncbi:hemolysin family protein [Paenibacillus sp. N1-5-1-14]|uniref:hemolysin family protein n=1 Tax=Paenibacillus radicibacter TaxID=2972488 RepID=UPI0021596FD9|nr:hemolysin family protein [Paenibacillus radicibacter]MCR8644490.1 hemolysin family protein [Paenibacillus radicibacter]
MDGIIVLNLILVAVFIALTAFFVGAEFAILKVRMSRIDQLVAEGNKKAVLAKKVAQELDYYLSACQLGITITALILGALGEPTVERILHPLFVSLEVPAALATVLSYGIALSLITFLHVVVGELAPKTLAIQYAEKMTLLLAPPLYWFGKVTSPIIKALNGSATLLLRIFGIKPSGHDSVHSEEEIKWIADQSYQSGEINKTEHDYLNNIIAFDKRKLHEIMIPQERIISIRKDMTTDHVIAFLNDYDYTRYPVSCNEKPNEYIGYLNAKEMLTAIAAGRTCVLAHFIHEMPRLSAQSSIRDVLVKMQQTRVHMAVVLNDTNTIVGLVTMEDILEEIVGDIRDESYRSIQIKIPPHRARL